MTSPRHSPVRWKNFGFQRIPLLAHGNPLRSSCLFQHLTLHSTMGRSNVLWDTLKTMCDTDVHSVRQPGGNWRCWCPVPSLLLPQPAQDAPRAGAEHSALRRPSNGSADTLIAFIFQRGQQQRPPDKILWTKIIFTFFFFFKGSKLKFIYLKREILKMKWFFFLKIETREFLFFFLIGIETEWKQKSGNWTASAIDRRTEKCVNEHRCHSHFLHTRHVIFNSLRFHSPKSDKQL